jgi:hypothetical protein
LKKIIIHAGGGKAGSSAIQNYCELHHEQLETKGYAYENRINISSEKQITSGNGYLLSRSLINETNKNDEIDLILKSYFGKCDFAICSSEHFSNLDADHWRRLWFACSRLSIDISIVYIVRDVLPYFQSGYDQAVKYHGEYNQFDDWVEGAKWLHIYALRNILSIVPRNRVKVLHYESIMDSLIVTFLKSIDVGLNFNIENDHFRVNRSLTMDERAILCMANKMLGSRYSKDLFNFLIGHNEGTQVQHVNLDKTIHEKINLKYLGDVKWINSLFFNGAPTVKIVSSSQEIGSKDSNQLSTLKDFSPSYEAMRLLSLWSLEKLRSANQVDVKSLLNNLKTLADNSVCENINELPPDFDALYYLVLNPDLVSAGINPFVHYLKSGRREGRKYKIR